MPSKNPQAAFRQTMMAINPDYFALEPAGQERYRLDLYARDGLRVDRALFWFLFGKRFEDFSRELPPYMAMTWEQFRLYSEAVLFVRGIGDALFCIDRPLDEGQTMASFETLEDYALAEHRQQQGYFRTDPRYRGLLANTPAHLRIEGRFEEAVLSMLPDYLQTCLDEEAADMEGKDRDRFLSRARAREAAISERIEREAPGQVYIFEEDEGDGLSFVFTDTSALKRVRLRHFWEDCTRIAADYAGLDALIERELGYIAGPRLAGSIAGRQSMRTKGQDIEPY